MLSFNRPQILIVGGIHKGGSIDQLAHAASGKVRLAIAFGRDKEIFVNTLKKFTNVVAVASLTDAVQCASSYVQRNDVVLFSPACSSFDMFANYQERGKAFQQAVEKIVQGVRHVD